jgi:hypothetical protein
MESTSPKTFVFVMMPFSDEFSDIYDVGIEPACRDAGAYCERVDKQIFMESILERVYNQIAKADIIVAVMTGRNPNVFYEVGYAHALNKRVILLTQNSDDIPFDLKHYPHVIYGEKIITVKMELEKRVRWCIENQRNSSLTSAIDLQFFIRDTSEKNAGILKANFTHKPEINFAGKGIRVSVDIYNPTGKVIDSDAISLSIISPVELGFEYPPVRSKVQLHDERYIYNLIGFYKLYPGGWDSIDIVMQDINFALMMKRGEFILRVFTELGPKDYEFIVKPYALW